MPVALLIIYLGAVRPIRIALEHAQFNRAEKELEQTYQQIVAAIGEPNEVVRDKSCGYGSALYERGPRSCGISIAAIYKKPGLDRANEIVAKVSNAVGDEAEGYMGGGLKKNRFAADAIESSQELSSSIVNRSHHNLVCQVDYFLSSQGLSTNINDEKLTVKLWCSASTLAEYYPVTED